jgi:predicted DNA-binding transcriptional regulator AlpA
MPKGRDIKGPRPPSYVSKATLAAELDVSESTIDNWVQRGVIPAPVAIGGNRRWCWQQVDAALSAQIATPDADPFLAGVSNV